MNVLKNLFLFKGCVVFAGGAPGSAVDQFSQ